METVRFYFSFRSPYAWLAFHLTPPALTDLPVRVERIPVFPPPNFPNDPTAVPAKLEYILEHDVPRLARAYGFEVVPPARHDIDWMPPHALWLHAEDHGAGDALGAELFAARFSRSQDLGDDEVLRECARRAGLEPGPALAAAHDPSVHSRVFAGLKQGLEDGIFGVPFYVYRGERFWGHDRIPWLVRSICEHEGRTPPPLPV